MIWESSVWKEDLQRELNNFLANIKRFNDEYFNLRVEKFFFISAFIIRKLNEANKLSDELVSKDFDCTRYRRIKDDNIIDFMNCHHIEKFYDLRNGEKSSLKLKYICNYFIHSFVFLCSIGDDDRLCGVFVNSDRTENKFLYYIELNTFIMLINDVINDDIVSVSYNRIAGKLKKSKAICYDSDIADNSG